MGGILRILKNKDLAEFDAEYQEVEDVYPVTSTKGVYHQFDTLDIIDGLNKNKQLAEDIIIDNTAIFNANAWDSSVRTFNEAVNLVPINFRKRGFILVYRDKIETSTDADASARVEVEEWKILYYKGQSVEATWDQRNYWEEIGTKCNCTTTPSEPIKPPAGGTEIIAGTINGGPTSGIPTTSLDPDKITSSMLVGREEPIEEGTIAILTKDDYLSIYTYNAATSEFQLKSYITAPKGDKGDKGDPGLTGPQGKQGIQGPRGDTPNITVISEEIDGGQNITIKPDTGEETTFKVYNGREISTVGASKWKEDTKHADCSLNYNLGEPPSIVAFRCIKVIVDISKWTGVSDDGDFYIAPEIEIPNIDIREHMVEFFYWAGDLNNYKRCTDAFVFMVEDTSENYPTATLACRNLPEGQSITVIFKIYDNPNDPLLEL